MGCYIVRRVGVAPGGVREFGHSHVKGRARAKDLITYDYEGENEEKEANRLMGWSQRSCQRR